MANYTLGSKAEKAFLKQFGGEFVTDKETQKRDIDVILNGSTISIKHHISSKKTNNLSFELRLSKSTDPTDVKAGNYVTSEASHYAHLIWKDEQWQWWRVGVDELKPFVGLGEKHVVKSLSYGQYNNGSTGYNRSESIIVPIKKCVASGLGIFIPLEGEL